jgi:hypothetical protein
MADNALLRPIGWWLKEADAAFDRNLDGRNVDRRGWQILASLARSPTRRSDLVTSLAAFDSPTAIEVALGSLIANNWIEMSAGLLRLTPDGEHEHADLAPLVDDVRSRVAKALPQDDYLTLVRLLERLVAAL